MNKKDNFKINKKQSTLMITLGITMLLMAIVGVTYAYFVVNLDFTPGSSINVEVGSFGDVAFVDGNEINLPGGYPGDILTKTFTVTRTNATDTAVIDYKIMLHVRENTLTPVSNGYFTYTLSGVKTGKGTLVTANNVAVPTSTSQIGSNGEFTGNGVHTYTFSIGLRESNGDQRSTMSKDFKGYLQVESIDTTYILTNLVENGNFENDTTGWSLLNALSRSNIKAKFGNYSIKNYNSNNTASASTTGYNINLNPNHIYYGSLWMYLNAIGSGQCGSGFNLKYDNNAPHWNTFKALTTLNTWSFGSTRFATPSVSSKGGFYISDYFGTDNNVECYTDGVLLVDLTATFGEGNEPPQEWCDANIPFFEGSKGFNFYTHKDLILHYDAIDNTLDGHSNSTSTWYDLSGNGRNGTLANFGSTLTSGWQNDKLVFDGSNDYVNMSTTSILNSDIKTVEISFKVLNYGGNSYGTLFFKGNGGPWINNHIQIAKNNTSSYFATTISDNISSTANNLLIYPQLNSSTISLKYDGENAYNYLNGMLNSQISTTILPASNSTIMYLGASLASNRNLNIEVYSVRMYNRVLTDAEIQYNYSVDRNRFDLE